MTDFEEKLTAAVQHSVLQMVTKGDWLRFESYNDRIPIDPSFLRGLYASLDRERIKQLLQAQIEERIADTIYNAMATEIATDVKQIMSNKELREDLRAYLRERMRAMVQEVVVDA